MVLPVKGSPFSVPVTDELLHVIVNEGKEDDPKGGRAIERVATGFRREGIAGGLAQPLGGIPRVAERGRREHQTTDT